MKAGIETTTRRQKVLTTDERCLEWINCAIRQRIHGLESSLHVRLGERSQTS